MSPPEDARDVLLIVVADDFGLHSSYDAGIIEAAEAGAIDAASVMVERLPARIAELAASGVALGLHLEGEGAEGCLDEGGFDAQLDAFGRLAGRAPDYLDGHHHCHARGAAAALVARRGAEDGVPVRSVDAAHRSLLREAGAWTPDLLVGRYEEDQPVIPAELISPPANARTIEWMVHPGHPDDSAGSDYDRGRGEDLAAVLAFRPPSGLHRGNHAQLA